MSKSLLAKHHQRLEKNFVKDIKIFVKKKKKKSNNMSQKMKNKTFWNIGKII